MTATPRDLDKKRGQRSAAALIAHVRGIREQADAVLTMSIDDLDWDDAVRVAHELKMAKAALAAAEEFVAKHAGAVWPTPWKEEQTVDGIGRANPYRNRNTNWDNDDVVKEVVDRRMAALEGEIPDPRDVVRWITEVAHIDYFRIGKLRDLDIDPNEYRHTVYGTVRLGIKSDDVIGATTHE
jgi:hypothetical protein